MANSTTVAPQSTPAMIPLYAPDWAERFGEDEFGIFAEFSLQSSRFVWRWICPGQFQMGSPASENGSWNDEGPQHRVTISRGFWLGETPVTQAQWIAIMGDNPSRFKGDQRPVEQVTWHQCVAFVEKLNQLFPELQVALPTEAQWEYACRAGTQGAFHIDGSKCSQPDGTDPVLDLLGWFDKNSTRETHNVRQKAANDWGLYDIHGNVWEWCRDEMRPYTNQAQRDPVGPIEEGAGRVLRGGSWGNRARLCRSAFRLASVPGYVWDGIGLRLSAGQEPDRRTAEPSVPKRRSRG